MCAGVNRCEKENKIKCFNIFLELLKAKLIPQLK